MSDPESAFPRPIATVDLAIFALSSGGLRVLLVRRDSEPFLGAWALPGGFIHVDEDANLEAAARRVLRSKTGVATPYLEQLQTVADGARDPRGWSLSTVYFALLPSDEIPSSAGDAVWRNVEGDGHVAPLAFDHAELLRAALVRVRNKVAYSTLPAHLLPAAFTLTELQSVYERILGRQIDKSAFRKRIAEVEFIDPIAGEWRRASNRPAQLYRMKTGLSPVYFDRTI